MVKYYRHKENPYVVGGVNWRKVIKVFGLSLLALLVCMYYAMQIHNTVEYYRDPRIRTEPEFYEHLTDTFEESEVQVIADGSDADIIFPDGTVAKCTAICDPDYLPDRISRIYIIHDAKSAGHTEDVVKAVMQVIEPEFIENDGWFMFSYEDLLSLCRECDASSSYDAFTDRAAYGKGATHITLGSTIEDSQIIKSITFRLLF